MIGAVSMILVEEGLLTLDEPVDRLLPELANRRVLRRLDGPLDDTVPAHHPITVRDLLTFTFGFGMVMEMFTAAERWPVVEAATEARLATIGPPQPDVPPDPDTWIAAFGRLPLLTQPGDRWLYNTGAHALSVLLARAAGMPLPEVLRTRLFEPLGMMDTGFWTAETDRFATAYAATPDGLTVWDAPDGQWSRPPAFSDGAAGLVSTADDVLAFGRMLLRGGAPVLSQKAVREMTRDHLTVDQRAGSEAILGDRSWGYCVSVLPTGANGWDGGLGASFLVDPARELVIVVLTQRLFETAQVPQMHTDLQEAAYDIGR